MLEFKQMNKIFAIVVIKLFIFNTSSFAFTQGTGEVKMSNKAVNHFISYIKGEANFKKKIGDVKPKPSMFILSSNGNWTAAWFCPYNACRDTLSKKTIEECERETGTNCGVFAARRTIYWENGINTKKNKTKFKSKMSDSEIRAKLTELGFLGGDISTSNTITPKITKKNENKEDVVKQLKDLKNLLDSGVITNDEFEKAKKKILN